MSLLDLDELPHLCDVLGPPLVTNDSSGGQVITWPTVAAASVPCQIMFGGGGERNEYSQSQFERNTHTIAFNGVSQSYLIRGYKLVDTRTGSSYRITGISNKQGIGGIPDYLIVQVTEVQDG